MTGRQINVAVIGDKNEIAAMKLLLDICSPTQVARQRDFGIDFYCALTEPLAEGGVTTTTFFGLQVGGSGKLLAYGSRGDEEHPWELDWLRRLTFPLYYGVISADRRALDIYSLSPVWRVLMQAGSVRRISVSVAAYVEGAVATHVDPQPPSDGNHWRVELGHPVARLDGTDAAAAAAIAALRLSLLLDHQTIASFNRGLAFSWFLHRWKTNAVDAAVEGNALYWNAEPGANVDLLLRTVAPYLTSLGAHLQWQDDGDAYSLLPVLELLQRRGCSTPLSEGLLTGLRASRQADETPGAALRRERKIR